MKAKKKKTDKLFFVKEMPDNYKVHLNARPISTDELEKILNEFRKLQKDFNLKLDKNKFKSEQDIFDAIS